MNLPKLTNETHRVWFIKWMTYLFIVVISTLIIQKLFNMPLWYATVIELVIIYIVLYSNVHEKFARWYVLIYKR